MCAWLGMLLMAPLPFAPTRVLFFTGKGGVGKTSLACATAMALADAGRRVLLVSTDPASNLDEVLGVRLSSRPTEVPGVPRMSALNVDPEAAAHAYRERVVGPYRAVLPASAVASIEEQLSGACTVEIAAFDEFTTLLADARTTTAFDHVVFDTAPTGHTLRLLTLPAAWTGFIETNTTGTSCLGPLAGLQGKMNLYRDSLAALMNPDITTVMLVSRPEKTALDEAARTSEELATLGVTHQHLIVNGIFTATSADDPIAAALERRGQAALGQLPAALAGLPRLDVPLRPWALLGADSLRQVFAATATSPPAPLPPSQADPALLLLGRIADLVDAIEKDGHGVVLTMGKGGVGKTTVAAAIAVELAQPRAHRALEHHRSGSACGRGHRCRRARDHGVAHRPGRRNARLQ